jgi:hypothetical protein
MTFEKIEGYGDEKMKKQSILVGIIVILITVGLSGCINEDEEISGSEYDEITQEQLLGTWRIIIKGNEELDYYSSYTFYDSWIYDINYDFTGTDYDYEEKVFSYRNYTYLIEENTLVVYFGPNHTDSYFNMYCRFSDNENTLTLFWDEFPQVRTVLAKES